MTYNMREYVNISPDFSVILNADPVYRAARFGEKLNECSDTVVFEEQIYIFIYTC